MMKFDSMKVAGVSLVAVAGMMMAAVTVRPPTAQGDLGLLPAALVAVVVAALVSPMISLVVGLAENK